MAPEGHGVHALGALIAEMIVLRLVLALQVGDVDHLHPLLGTRRDHPVERLVARPAVLRRIFIQVAQLLHQPSIVRLEPGLPLPARLLNWHSESEIRQGQLQENALPLA